MHTLKRALGARRKPSETPDAPPPGIDPEIARQIEESGLFDAHYYLANYPDALSASQSPLLHFLAQPPVPPRNPCSRFDAASYFFLNPDVAMAGVNALVHYVLYGQTEQRRFTAVRPTCPPPTAPDESCWEDLARRLPPAAPDAPLVHVVVPVYRGLDETANCLRTLLESRLNAPIRCDVTVIDDKSPEPELSALLDRLAGMGLFTLVRNRENLGFVASVNLGMARLPGHDVILLNADTEVYGDWVERLRAAVWSAPDIGTATPFSNNATICSYPLFCANFNLPFEVSHREIDAMARQANAGRTMDIPTGVGFCLYIRRDCLDAVGLFREDIFGLGYGEENDFCRRALGLGWRSVLAADTFVRHFGKVSFLDSSEERSRNAQRIIDEIHPDYLPAVGEFCTRDPLRPLRENLDLARLRAVTGERAVLFVSPSLGGGTEQHQQDMETLLRREGAGVLYLRPVSGGKLEIGRPDIQDLVNLPAFDLDCGPSRLAGMLGGLGVFHIHVHHLLGFPLQMPEYVAALAEAMGLRYDVTLHDYAAACPRINMIDESGAFCDTLDPDICQDCVNRNGSPAGQVTIWRWRMAYEAFLSRAAHVFVPHGDLKDRLRPLFPRADFRVRPHPEIGGPMDIAPLARAADEPLRVALIGAIGPHKGFDVLVACARAALRHNQPITFVVVGYCSDMTAVGELHNVEVTGPYRPGELPGLLEKSRCHLAFLPAVWPETYSYTLTQAFQAGLYPVCFDLGAPAARIREVAWGELLPLELRLSPKKINEALLACAPPPRPHGLLGRLGGSYASIERDYYGLGATPPEPERAAAPDAEAAPPAIPPALSGHVTTVEGRHGPVRFYDFDAVIGRSLSAYGEWGQRELDLLSRLIEPGAVVVDGGAHVGVYTQALARAVGPKGRVLAFEPNPALHPLLAANAADCPCPVQADNAALDAAPGQVHIALPEPSQRANLGALALRQMAVAPSRLTAAVPVVTLDSLALRRLDFIKLDLEGMEARALRGASDTLAALQPLVYLECNRPLDGWRCLELAAAYGYKGIFCRFPAYNPDNWRGNSRNFFGPAHESGLLLFPVRFARAALDCCDGRDVFPVDTLEDVTEAVNRTPRYGDVTMLDRDLEKLAGDLTEFARETHGLLDQMADQKMWSERDRHIAMFLREAWRAARDASAPPPESGVPVADELLAVLERSGYFNAQFYLAAYPGVKSANISPLYHFLTEGWKQGFLPSPDFDTVAYLQRYPDVRESGQNPLLHFLFYGKAENRNPGSE